MKVTFDKAGYWTCLVALVVLAGLRQLELEPTPRAAYIVGVVFLFCAIGVASWRGRRANWVFPITLAAVYPGLAPFLARDVFGYRWYTGLLVHLQTSAREGQPSLIAGLACVAIAFGLTAEVDKPAEPRSAPISALALKSSEVSVGLVVGGIGSLLFAYLAEPGGIVYFSSYADIQAEHLHSFPFASGAWAVFACLALYSWLALRRGPAFRIKESWFWLSVGGSCVYLLLHAHRSELLGFFFLFASVSRVRVTRWKLAVATLVLVASFVVVGQIRSRVRSLDLSADPTAQQNSLPGGPGNVAIGWVAGYWLLETGQIDVLPGETYWGRVLSLPPKFLGLPRPATAYQRIDRVTPLIGGEYFVIEPMMNLGVVGVCFYVIAFVYVAGRSARAVRVGGVQGFVLGGTFMSLLMRTLWYGMGAVVKSEIIALLVALGVGVLLARRRGRAKA